MTPAPIQDPSLFDAIAELLPAHLREHFYRRMAHLRQLAPNDDILIQHHNLCTIHNHAICNHTHDGYGLIELESRN